MCEIEYTFSGGCTPEEILKKQLEKHCPDDSYTMSLVGDDQEIAIEAINQGIDSHLQAVTFNNEPSFRQDSFEGNGKTYYGPSRLDLDTTNEGIVVLCRRLLEYWENCDCSEEEREDECKHETAYQLRSCILWTLGIEEI